MTFSQEGELIATGESGPLPGLIVWSSFTMKICFMDKYAGMLPV